MPRPLAEGLYENVLTRALDEGIRATEKVKADVVDLPIADAHLALARHVEREVARALASVPKEDRSARQVEIVADLLSRLGELVPSHADALADQHLAPPARRLDAIYPERGKAPPRPSTPLSSSTLLTRNRAEPSLGHELEREIHSADHIAVVAAFITVSGVRAVLSALESFVRRGGTMRVLTTVFTGTTEVEAVDMLSRLPGVEVRVSHDVRRTRLHAKAWLFHRNSELHTAYVGSANLTATALGAGQEWMVKVCAADLPHVIEKFEGTIASLWNDPEFESYDPSSEDDRTRLRGALKSERSSSDKTTVFFNLRPFPYQEEILDRLQAERVLHGRRRNLLVAATGTGKTVIAAFDYQRFVESTGIKPRLLFLAHRREILEQARATFAQVVRQMDFGELWTDGLVPERWDHVFATIQTADDGLLARVGPDFYRYVVVDEAHHAPARSYQKLIPHLRPEILLGLTATPERTDGKSLLPDFDGCVAAELRLWHAFDRQLLVPFEYYGVADGTDLRKVAWSRSGYAIADLAGVYTGNEARVDLIVEQMRRRVVDVRSVRAIAFCVSVAHAEFMAKSLTERGVPAIAVHGGSADDLRSDAPRRLHDREINVICTCDLYNEGVDLPFVDVLLLLRPTSSATLFMQQIGRGLRLHARKTTCLVLDFIGQHRSEFRFDALYEALTGTPRGKLSQAVQDGFPFLPSGCVLQLDHVARDRILESLKQAVRADRLVEEAKNLASPSTPLTLARFLDETGRDLADVYSDGVGGWTTLRGKAGLIDPPDAETAALSARLGSLLHVDEPTRLRSWGAWKGDDDAGSLSPYERRRLTMLDFQLHHRGVIREPERTVEYFAKRPAIREELSELAGILESRVGLAAESYPVAEWPLALHRHYTRREIVAAVGYARPGRKGSAPMAGILMLEEERREVMFVTLDKSGASFSPTTRYRDYAISRTLFHWETQTITSVSRPSGLRYLESPGNGWSFHLFVRKTTEDAYAFLGPVRYQSHSGDRPIGITWLLETPMPAGLFEQFATLSQG